LTSAISSDCYYIHNNYNLLVTYILGQVKILLVLVIGGSRSNQNVIIRIRKLLTFPIGQKLPNPHYHSSLLRFKLSVSLKIQPGTINIDQIQSSKKLFLPPVRCDLLSLCVST